MNAAALARQFTYFRTLQKNLRLHEILHGDVCGISALRRHVIEQMRKLAKLMRYGVGAPVLFVLMLAGPALAQQPHRHPVADEPLHEQFYSKWYMPDNPGRSCCNKADCYPTVIRYVDGRVQARRREDGAWLPIPEHKIERNRDNPDGRSHVCAPPPNTSYPPLTVFCFTLGGGT